MNRPCLSLFVLTLFFVTAAGVTAVVGGDSSEQCTKDAWDAFNKKDFEGALSAASQCSKKFQSGADVKQNALKARSEDPPDVEQINQTLQDFDTPKKEKENLKKRYLSRGPLNDVPSCFWIMGQSLEEMGNTEGASDAYHQASQYDYGLTWDPKGYFWSAARDAGARAKRLGEGRK